MKLVTRIANVNSPVIYVKAGRQVSGALTKTGLLYTWGRCGKHNMLGYSPSEDEMDGDEGETKTSQPIPRSVQALKQVVAFDFGIDHAAAVTKNGQLFTWGEGKSIFFSSSFNIMEFTEVSMAMGNFNFKLGQ